METTLKIACHAASNGLVYPPDNISEANTSKEPIPIVAKKNFVTGLRNTLKVRPAMEE